MPNIDTISNVYYNKISKKYYDYYPIADGVPSIMRWGYHGYKVPQVHDYTDLANKY